LVSCCILYFCHCHPRQLVPHERERERERAYNLSTVLHSCCFSAYNFVCLFIYLLRVMLTGRQAIELEWNH
jgi:hypothetical protein